MKNPIRALLALFGRVSTAAAPEPEFGPGQCWSYSTRPGDESSFLVIRKIETLPKIGEVAHISVFELKIKNPGAPSGVTEQAGHIPISLEVLRSSLVQKVDRRIPKIDWTEGYALWREAYDSGRGGVFAKPVRECVAFMEGAINKN